MFSQQSINPDSVSCGAVSRVAIGSGLNGASPNLSPISGAIALEDSTERLYLGSSGVWKAMGDVIGPVSSTDNALARFDGTTGKIIQNSVVTLSDTGDLAGVTTINGDPVVTGTNTGDVTLAAFGNVPNANGANLAGQVLTLQPASTTQPGGVNTAAQSFAGVKDFSTSGLSLSPAVGGLNNVLQGASGYYKTGNIPITWDPNSVLFAAPIVATIRCERIGDMIFIKVQRLSAQPVNVDRLESNIGVVPVQFRPSAARGFPIVIIEGNVNYIGPNNTDAGYAILYPTGQLAIGCAQSYGAIAGQNLTGVANDGLTLFPFNGPNQCGILAQTLMFEA